jgi:exonuclease SbcD
MRLLHSSDWHVGRTFHGNSTVAALREVLGELVAIARRERVDAVLVAGDVFDSAMPAGEHFDLLAETLAALRDAGPAVIVTSGNHDSPARLGFQAALLREGVHVITRPEQILEPIVLRDEHGPVAVYGIPYLEPALYRHRHPELQLRSHDAVLAHVMDGVRADLAERRRMEPGLRATVLAHCFAVGVDAAGPERDITAGGVEYVALERFAGVDYAALGHIHSRAELAPGIRYSGAPLHSSFKEAGKPRGAWLVELDADGLVGAEWAELPVPRPLVELTGTLEELLTEPRHAAHEQHWVSAVLTDRSRPTDAMAKLQGRFPHCATLEHRPAETHDDGASGYAERMRSKTDPEIVADFLTHVRNGDAATPDEDALLREELAVLESAAD